MLKKVALVSLGCSKNQVDSELVLGNLKNHGFQITSDKNKAEVLIINTCGFIEAAKEESIETILNHSRLKDEGSCNLLVVCGCLSERYRETLKEEMPEIDILLGTRQWDKIGEIISGVLKGEPARDDFSSRVVLYSHEDPRYPINLTGYKGSAYIKIAEGCDNYCSYCAIPLIRGTYKSRTIESIKKEAIYLVEQGVKEVNLIAQETTRFGLDLYGEFKLNELLKELADVRGLQWIRLLYAHPARIDEELIETIAGEAKICPYIDLPLQHANDRILTEMNRKGGKEEFRHLITKLREKIPGINIRTSFMVGFPGESEADFNELLEFMQEIGFDQTGIFTYSSEENTKAAQFSKEVDEAVKQERYKIATELQQEITRKKRINWIGSDFFVLVDSALEEEEGTYLARTKFQAPEVDGSVIVPGATLEEGDFTKVRISQVLENDLIGEITYEPCK